MSNTGHHNLAYARLHTAGTLNLGNRVPNPVLAKYNLDDHMYEDAQNFAVLEE